MLLISLMLYAFFNFQLAFASAPTDILFLISAQDSSSYHRQLSETLRRNLQAQAVEFEDLNKAYTIRVSLLNELFSGTGDWTLLSPLSCLKDAKFRTPSLLNENTKWIILCEESTHVNVSLLLEKLAQLNHSEAAYFGFPLHDQDATIIHHFAFFENPKWFPYPMLRAGVAFTVPLLSSLAATFAGQGIASGVKVPTRTTDFSIDAAHELARFILDHVRIERGVSEIQAVGKTDIEEKPRHHLSENFVAATQPPPTQSLETTSEVLRFKNVRKMILQRASFVCPTAPSHVSIDTSTVHKLKAKSGKFDAACAMYAKPMDVSSCIPIKRQQIFFAIKTCKKFHRERLPVIEATWAPYAAHRRYYSDITDASIPTIGTGIPNADTGHCSKTLAILKLALKDIEQLNRELQSIQSDDVVVDGDGDVGIGVRADEAVAAAVGDISLIRWLLLVDDDTLLSISHLCEFLGCFNHTETVYLGERYGYRLHAEDGFNYITGGGGIVLSLPLVKLILKHCTCPTIASPDDMILGACLHVLGIEPIHSSRFHQARPNDYPPELLHLESPISFHKFWQLDPIQVYDRWFATADRAMLSSELLKNKSQQQNGNLKVRLKEFANRKNKSQYATGGLQAQSCQNEAESRQMKNYQSTKMETKNQVPFGIEAASLVPLETASHMDL